MLGSPVEILQKRVAENIGDIAESLTSFRFLLILFLWQLFKR